MAKEVGEAVEEVHFSERFGAEEHPALAFLEREFFHYPHESFREEPKEIALYEAKTPLSEITHVAAGITRLLREGYRYSDMVVMGRNVDAYRTEIMAEFERFGIPYYLDRKLPLIRHRAGTALLSAVSALCHNWDSERIMRYLKCGYSDLEKDAIDRLENYVLATGIRGQAWYREEAWDMPLDTYAADDYPRENEGDLQNEMDRARRIAAEPLLRLYEGLKGERTLKEDTEAVVAFLEEIRFAEKLEQEAGAGGRAGEEDAQIYEEMMAVLRALCRSLGDVKVRPDDFYSMLEVGLSKRAIGAIPHSLDHVQISDIARAKGMGAKVVFLIGTEDGVFPQTISKQGFFNDHNRAVLAESGILLAPDSRHRAYMEQNLVYAALTAASDRLYVSYALTDAAGEEQFPSRIIERLRQVFPLLTTQNDRGGMPQEDRILTAKGTFLPMLEHLRLCRAGMEEEIPEYRAAFRWYEEQDEWREKIEAARKTEEEDLSPKNLSSETAGKLYGTHLSASISRLETYRKCPFRYFAQYGLALKERKEYGLNPMDTGSFLHRIMEEFSRTLAFHQTAWKDLTDEELLRHLDDVMPGILAHCSAYLIQESPRMANRFLRLKKTAKTSLEIMRSHFQKGAFEPLGYELTFAEGGDLDPICIALPEGSVSLRGKIDRADRVETEDGVFYRVVDYKSGNKEFDLSEVYHGLSIQLMVYMDTLLENRQKAGEKALPAAAVYYRLTDPVIRAMPQSGEEEIRAQIEEKMKLEGMIVTEQAAMAAMDQCPAGGKSTVAAIKQNANGTYRGTSVYKSVTLEQYERLREHVREIIREIAADMMSGTIEAKPYRDKKIHPCGSCSYRAVCGFDDQIECYRYDEEAHLSGKKVWERLEGES